MRRTLGRTLLFGAMSIALMGAGTLASILWLTRGGAPGASYLGEPEPVPVPVAPAPQAPPVRAQAPAIALGPARDPAAASAAAAASLGDPIIAATIRRPPHRLSRGSAAPVALFAGLRELESRISSCVEEDAPSQGAHDGPAAGGSQAVLSLELETLDGKVRIVDAPVQARGSASEAAIRCAQRELLGQEIRVELSQPGMHVRLPFALKKM